MKLGEEMNEEYASVVGNIEPTIIKPVKPPFGYYGAKQRIAKKIVDTLPPHNAWVEGFCGSAALTLAKPAAPIEVINDKDDQIVNLFEQLRNNSEALYRAISLTPYARAEFENARKKLDISDPLEKARRFLVATMMTVNATIEGDAAGFSYSSSYSRGEKEARVNRWHNLPTRLEKVVARLKNIRIENVDARELIKKFIDRPATLVYLDPPYFVKRQFKYVIDANDEGFHKELLEICIQAKCMILISAYECDLYNLLLTPELGWVKKEIETTTRDTKGVDYSKTEVLWMNKHYMNAKENNQVPIELTSDEKKNRKLNPAR